ncbi:Ger(x)C family spore germination protein [Psychrobacillus sp.]|uniref:Ger(x)C family spore germination protein n=1 Tax=Psychrobacillus sp. TaxID=1871623 RepID=UPI0028BD1D84|nr:Ger(x)C family spore germination protein [Psychrobacillus sp.]
MKRKIVIIFVSVLFLLSGCWDENEPERMLYIYGLGIDYKDGKYEVFAQIIDFSMLAKTEQPNTQATQLEVGHATGTTVDEALYELYHTLDQQLFWGHLTYLVLSEEVLKYGNANPIINTFVRYRETRYQTWVYSTQESVKEVMLLTPILNKGISHSKIADPMNSYKQESFIEPISLRKLIIRLNEPSYEVNIPLVTIKDNWSTEKGPDKVASITGVSVTNPKGFKQTIMLDKVRGLQWMTNETKRGEVTVNLDTNKDNYLTVDVDKINVKVKPITDKGEVMFDINVIMEVTVSGFLSKVTEDEVRKGVEKEVQKEIEETYKEGLKHDTDIYRLSEYLYRDNVKVWKKVHKDGKVELTENSIRKITVDVNKVDSGRKSYRDTISEE